MLFQEKSFFYKIQVCDWKFLFKNLFFIQDNFI
jgi:hypothetical protein